MSSRSFSKVRSERERHRLFAEYGIDKPSLTLMERAGQRLKPSMDLAVAALKIAKEELKSPIRLPAVDTLRAWRHGFSRMQYLLFGLGKNDPSLYVPKMAGAAAGARINDEAGSALKNKLFSSAVLKDLGAPCPEIRALILKGEPHSLDGSNHRGDSLVREAVEQDPRGVVLKPSKGYKGIGIAFIKKGSGDYLINGKPASWDKVASLISLLDDYLVTEFIAQHEYASRIFSRTTNTIRLLSMWNCDTGEPFIVAPVHRIGTSRSYPVDNFKAGLGGLCAPIDFETGELGQAVYRSDDGHVERLDNHPETGSPIKGVEVPFWAETKNEITRLATAMPYLGLVAWDVVMTSSGYCLLEANPGAGLNVHQIIAPLLEDSRVKRFFEFHGLL